MKSGRSSGQPHSRVQHPREMGGSQGGWGDPQVLPQRSPNLSPSALLVYRVFRNEAKRSTKTLHALLHGLALVIALVGGCWGWG